MKSTTGTLSLFRKSLRNAAWSSVDYTIVPLLWVLTTPFFVASLGVEQYGIWMLVNAFIGFSGVATFGLGDATIRFVAKYNAIGDVRGIEKVVRLTSFTHLCLSLLLPCFFFVFSPFLIDTFFDVSPVNRGLSVTALQYAGFAMAFRLMDVLPTSILLGFQRFDLAAKIRIPASIATMLLNVILVSLGYSIITLIVATMGVLAASIACKLFVIKGGLLPEFSIFSPGSVTSIPQIRSFALSSWLQGVGGMLLGQADRLLVASFLGARSLAYYTVCVQLAQQIHSFLSQGLAFLLPMASGNHERGDTQTLRKVYFAATNMATIIAVAIGIPIFLLSHDLLELWISKSFADEGFELLRMFILVFTLLATSIVPHYLMNATGYFGLNTILALSGGTLVTVFSLYFIPAFGPLGVAISRLLSLPISIAGRTVVHFRVLGDRRWYAAFPVFVPTILVFGSLYLASSVVDEYSGIAKVILTSVMTLGGTGTVAALLLAMNRDPAGQEIGRSMTKPDHVPEDVR